MTPRTRRPALLALVCGALLAALTIGPNASARTAAHATSAAGTPVHGGDLVIARTQDSTSMDATSVFDNESIWVFEQIMEPLYTVTARRQEREAVARDELHALAGQEDLHVPAAQGRVLPQRQGDDVRRRGLLAQRRPHHEGRLGLHRHRDQERHGQGQVPGRGQDQVPVGTAARRHRAVLELDRAGQLRRQDEGAVLHRARRHRPVQVGSLDARQGAQARPLRQVLADGQAVPEQRHLDERARRQHARAAAQGRPGAGRRVPRLVAGRAAQGDLGHHDDALPLDAHRLRRVQRALQAASRTSTSAGRSPTRSTARRS